MYHDKRFKTGVKWPSPALRLLLIGSLSWVLAACAPDASSSVNALSPASVALPQATYPSGSRAVFATPEQAFAALMAATRDNREADLLKILGTDARHILYSGDSIADTATRARFVAAYDQAHEIREDDATHRTLVVGTEAWPLPIPLVHTGQGWWFDTALGQEEILNRRIGRNELNVLGVCRVYVEAQREFSALHAHASHPNTGQPLYAQRFRSTPGQHDGLYWPVANDQAQSPLGAFLASAADEGYTGKVLSKKTPYNGYYYRILKGQGSHAAGGKKNYVVDGQMRGGFALLAFPDRYGDSGVMTFIVNQNGIVYEKNLGPHTAEIARAIQTFDPDASWNLVQQ